MAERSHECSPNVSECNAHLALSRQEANATNHQIKQSMYLMNRVLRL
eukprot:SAG31_NODE_102_length_25175_cov_10.778553_5_plen_47_part_00